jgi:hypothetical protein
VPVATCSGTTRAGCRSPRLHAPRAGDDVGAVASWSAYAREPTCPAYFGTDSLAQPQNTNCAAQLQKKNLLLGASVVLSIGAIWAFVEAFKHSGNDSRAVFTVGRGARPSLRLPAPVYIAPQRVTRVELLRVKF